MCSFHVLILHFPWALLAFTRFGIQNLWKNFKYSTYRILNRRDQKGRFRYEKYLRVWNYYVAEPHLTTNIWDWGQTTVWRAVCGKSARTVPWRAVNKPYVPPELIQQVYTVYGVYTRFGVVSRPHLAAWFSAPWRAWWVTLMNFAAFHAFDDSTLLIARCCPKYIDNISTFSVVLSFAK